MYWTLWTVLCVRYAADKCVYESENKSAMYALSLMAPCYNNSSFKQMFEILQYQ